MIDAVNIDVTEPRIKEEDTMVVLGMHEIQHLQLNRFGLIWRTF